jgi:hypothetical protein
MAKQTSFKVTAKDATRQAFSSVRRGLGGLSNVAGNVFRRIGQAGLVAGAAIVGFAVKSVQAHNKQERSERALASALAAHGEEAGALLPKLKAVAAAIQDQTGAADEDTLALMANLRMLGVRTAELEKAAKATMALTAVGVREKTARRAVAAAMQGNYDRLTSYVPALRKATSEAEKAAIVNKLFAKGFQQLKDLLNTNTGAWGNFTGRVGDAMEEVGKFISRAIDLPGLLNRSAEAIKTLGNRINQYIDSEQFESTRRVIKGIIEDIAAGGDQRSKAFEIIGQLLKLYFRQAGEEVVDIIKRAAPEIGRLAGAAAQAAAKAAVQAAAQDAKEAVLPGDPYLKEARRRLGAPRRSLVPGAAATVLWRIRDPEAKKLAAKLREQAMHERKGIDPPKPRTEEGEEDPELTPTEKAIQSLHEKVADRYRGVDLPDVVEPEDLPGVDIGADGADGADAASRGLSRFAESVMGQLRERGHTVTQFAAAPMQAMEEMRQREAEKQARDESVSLARELLEVQKQTKELLKRNLEVD